MVVGIWLVTLVVLTGASKVIVGTPASTPSLSNTDSATAAQLIYRAFPGAAAEANPIMLESETLDFRTGAGAEVVQRVGNALDALPYTTIVVTPAEVPSLTSADGHIAQINTTIMEADAGKDAVAVEVIETATEAAGSDVAVSIGGYLGSKLSAPNTHMSEAFGIAAAVLVLFLAMRRWVATFIPLINAMIAVGVGLAGVQIMANLVFIPTVATTLGIMLGLGVGIDYALFLVIRHRILLAQGYQVADAAGRTAGTAGAGMIFAGATLIAAVCGLALTQLSFLAWLGYAAALVVFFAVIASITLVPALLGIAGDRVIPKNAQSELQNLDTSRWARLATAVVNKPWRYAIGSTAVLLALAAPATSLTLGQADAGMLPPSTTAKQAYDAAAEAFGPGITGPLAITLELYEPAAAPTDPAANTSNSADPTAVDPRRNDPRLLELTSVLAQTPGVHQVNQAIVSPDGGVAVIRVEPEYSGSDPRTTELVSQLRTNILPTATEGMNLGVHVGGVTAATSDLMHLIAQRTTWFILGVVVLAFLLLMVAYRSLLIPLKAALLNLVSIAAAYGVVVMVFQWGWGASLIGVQAPVVIESYVPMMLFAVLFGLSMDYEVFLLTAFREHWERSGDMVTAIRRGLADTGKVITAAAAIMCVVFGSFVISDNVIVKMFGVGLATAVFVDASIVRCLLVPAFMVLAAKGTWWLPRWLDLLLPQLHVEGDPKALDRLNTPTDPAARKPQQSRSTRIHRRGQTLMLSLMVLLVWAFILVLGWAMGFSVADGPGKLLPAAGLSSIAGALLVLLPRRTSQQVASGLSQWLAFSAGAITLLCMVGLVILVAPPQRGVGWLLGWASVLTGMLLIMASRSRWFVPAVLGLVTMITAIWGFGSFTETGELLAATLLPAALVVLFFAGANAAIHLPAATKTSNDAHVSPGASASASASSLTDLLGASAPASAPASALVPADAAEEAQSKSAPS